MFVAGDHLPHAGVGCTSRCHPEPGRDAFVGDVAEGSAVPRARRVWALLAAHYKSDYQLIRPRTRRTGRNSSRMNTYAICSANPCGMNTSKIIELKASCNQHLQKRGVGEVLLLANGH